MQKLSHAKKNEVTFTLGGSEAINTAIFGAALRYGRKNKHIVTTAIEHSATKNALKKLANEGFSVTEIMPEKDGAIDAEKVADAIGDDTFLVSVMAVNNETGAILPVSEIKKRMLRKKSRALLHVDAVQALFKIPLHEIVKSADFLSVSGHKIGAPKGIGALYIKSGLQIPPLIYGGGQENGMRSGTEPMPAIAAFAEACRIRSQNFEKDLVLVEELSAYMIRRLTEEFPDTVLIHKPYISVPHIINISVKGKKSEVLIRLLEQKDVYVSGGSACAKGHRSHVLEAMGFETFNIDSAIRISFSPYNTKEDADAFITALAEAVESPA